MNNSEDAKIYGIMNSLNERQRAVYIKLLKLDGEPINLKDLCDYMYYEQGYSEFKIDDYHNFNNTAARRTLTADIRAINDCDYVDKFIVSNSQGVALANDKTYLEELKKEKIKILRQLKLYWKKVKKANRNRQLKIDFENEEIIAIESLVKSVEL